VSYDVTFAGARLFDRSSTLAGGRALYDLNHGLGYEALTLRGQNDTSQKLYLALLPKMVYVGPDPLPKGALPAGKVWIAVPFDAGARDRATLRLAAQVESTGAELPLAEVAWGAKDVMKVGTSVIRHVPMTEYRATVDLKQALAAARRHGRSALAAAMAGELAAGHGKPLAVELWVNGPGYVSRLQRTAPGSELGTATVSLSAFTQSFGRSLPLASQTVLLSSLPGPRRSLWAVATGAR
jgi:hypothetical protein